MAVNNFTNRAYQRTVRPHLHTTGAPISPQATVQVDGLVCMRSHGQSSNISYPVPWWSRKITTAVDAEPPGGWVPVAAAAVCPDTNVGMWI